MSESHPAITTVMSVLIITSIVGNFLVCAVVKRNRDMRTPISYLLVNLALSDILFAIFYIPKIILSYTFTQPEGLPGRILCTLLTDGTLAWVGSASSVFTLAVIATERYHAVIYPTGNKRKLTMYLLKFVIPGIWILSVILHIREFGKKIDHNICNYVWSEVVVKAVSVMWHAIVFLSSLLMAGLYSRVVYTLWFKRNDDNELTYQQQGVLKIRKKVTLMVVTVSAIFEISWGTHSILHVLDDIGSYKLNPFAIPISHVMLMFNSAVNPFAYALINQRFREKINRLIFCCSSRVHAAREFEGIEMRNKNTNVQASGPSSRQ